MKTLSSVLTKLIAIAGLVAVLGLASSDLKSFENSVVDLRAALLVFIAPILLLVLFQTQSLAWGQIFRRFFQVIKLNDADLLNDLEKNTLAARGQYGYSHLLKMTENHTDLTVKYAGEVYSARFNPSELARLLTHRAQAEDAQWKAVYSTFGFLAKMAPYFGMMATVIGMVKLIKNMSDFEHISGDMALALQGTLYGLVSFLLVYSPMQRFIQEFRGQIMKRNEMIVQWFVLIAEQADPTFIQTELRASSFAAQTPVKPSGNSLNQVQAESASARSST